MTCVHHRDGVVDQRIEHVEQRLLARVAHAHPGDDGGRITEQHHVGEVFVRGDGDCVVLDGVVPELAIGSVTPRDVTDMLGMMSLCSEYRARAGGN